MNFLLLLCPSLTQTREARAGGSGEHRAPRRRLGGRPQAAVRARKFGARWPFVHFFQRSSFFCKHSCPVASRAGKAETKRRKNSEQRASAVKRWPNETRNIKLFAIVPFD